MRISVGLTATQGNLTRHKSDDGGIKQDMMQKYTIVAQVAEGPAGHPTPAEVVADESV
jgi:hypothetical protein